MKQKLTITLDADLLPKAKRYVRSQGISLSSLIEKTLREITAEYYTSFSGRWKGKFEAAEGDSPRYEALAKKYLY